MNIHRVLPFCLMALLTACSTFDVSSGHLRNSVPRYTTFTTESPDAMANCISQHWNASGHPALAQEKTDSGFALQSTQKFDLQQKEAMLYVAVDSSREGSSVRFYSNHASDMVDRSMVSIIQACH